MKLCTKIDFSENFALKTLALSTFLKMNSIKFFPGTKPYLNLRMMSVQHSFDRMLNLKLCERFEFSENFRLKTIVISNSREIDITNFFC